MSDNASIDILDGRTSAVESLFQVDPPDMEAPILAACVEVERFTGLIVRVGPDEFDEQIADKHDEKLIGMVGAERGLNGVNGCSCEHCMELAASGARLALTSFLAIYRAGAHLDDAARVHRAYRGARGAIRERAEALGVDFEAADVRAFREAHRRDEPDEPEDDDG